MKEFETKADFWGIRKRKLISEIHKYFTERIFHNCWIEVHMFIHIEKSKLFTKLGKLKKIDASNRIKATHDALSEIINIDDKHFSVGKSEFILSNKNEIDILLLPSKIKTKEDIEIELKNYKT